jgi:hypothetical protein
LNKNQQPPEQAELTPQDQEHLRTVKKQDLRGYALAVLIFAAIWLCSLASLVSDLLSGQEVGGGATIVLFLTLLVGVMVVVGRGMAGDFDRDLQQGLKEVHVGMLEQKIMWNSSRTFRVNGLNFSGIPESAYAEYKPGDRLRLERAHCSKVLLSVSREQERSWELGTRN